MAEHGEPHESGLTQINPQTRITQILRSARLAGHAARHYVETTIGEVYDKTLLGSTFYDDASTLWRRHLESLGEPDSSHAYRDPRLTSYYLGGLLALSARIPAEPSLRHRLLVSEARPVLAADLYWEGTSAKRISEFRQGLDDEYRDLPNQELTAVNLAITELCATVSTSTHDEHERETARGYAAMAGTMDGMMMDLARRQRRDDTE